MDDVIAERRARVAEAPDDSDRQYNLGLALMQSVEPQLRERTVGAGHLVVDEAESRLRTALSLFARHGRAHIMLGLLLRYTNRHAEAEPHLRFALGLPRESNDWRIAADGLAGTLMELNRHADAVPLLEDAIRAHPRDPWLHLKLGSSLYFAHRMPEAKLALEAGLRSNPGHPQLTAALREVDDALRAASPAVPANVADVQRRAQDLGAALQQKVMALMQGPLPPEQKAAEVTRLQQEFQAELQKLMNSVAAR
jgi:tetratricopeptide (TPR) repeat protein